MQVRYNPQAVTLLIVLGSLNLIFGIILTFSRGFHIGVITGLLFVGMGVMMRSRTYFSVDREQVVLQAMIGPLKRTFPISSPSDVKLENNALYVKKDDRWQNVGVAKWMSHKDDWYNLQVYMQRLATAT